MRSIPALALLLAVLLLPVAAAGPGAAAVATTGPFVGAVTEGETDTHRYSTTGPLTACLDVYDPRTYTVTLAYAPAADTLALTANGVRATSEDGTATVRFTANYCTTFAIQVEGIDVAALAAYTVHVNVSSGGGALS